MSRAVARVRAPPAGVWSLRVPRACGLPHRAIETAQHAHAAGPAIETAGPAQLPSAQRNPAAPTDGPARRLTRRTIETARVVAHLGRRALSASAEIPTSRHLLRVGRVWPSKRLVCVRSCMCQRHAQPQTPSAPSKRRGPSSVSLSATSSCIPIAERGREARPAVATVAMVQ